MRYISFALIFVFAIVRLDVAGLSRVCSTRSPDCEKQICYTHKFTSEVSYRRLKLLVNKSSSEARPINQNQATCSPGFTITNSLETVKYNHPYLSV